MRAWLCKVQKEDRSEGSQGAKPPSVRLRARGCPTLESLLAGRSLLVVLDREPLALAHLEEQSTDPHSRYFSSGAKRFSLKECRQRKHVVMRAGLARLKRAADNCFLEKEDVFSLFETDREHGVE